MFPGTYRRGGVFEAVYRAYSVGFAGKMEAEHGDKLILPQSALDKIAGLHVQYPITFRIENRQQQRHSHCGVLEFTAEEGKLYMPYWMMQNLVLEEGSLVHIQNVSLPKGTYVKLQPHTTDFLDISNPKAVLERTLRGYTCLTKGDTFVLHYNDRQYYVDVVDAKPQEAISVIETDCNVDFAPPKDYKEPQRPAQPQAMPMDVPEEPGGEEEDKGAFAAFTGRGFTVGGASVQGPTPSAATATRGERGSSSGGGIVTKDGQAKAGKMMFGGGNRLEQKLNQRQQPQAPPQQSTTDDSSSKEGGGGFVPFQGKPNKLR